MEALVVDDEPSILTWMSATLRSLGITVRAASSAEEALAMLDTHDVGFVITDFMMPRINGSELLDRIRKLRPVLPVVVMSGVASVEDAVNVLRLGADDFLRKPIKRDLLVERLTQIIEKARIYEEARMFRTFLDADAEKAQGGMVTRSPAMLRLVSRLPSIARTDASVIVGGPSGSGKELIARAIHRLSPRADKPFVAVNCGAIPENLVESTLFGHAKGSFTGADRDSIGLARSAHGGTLFLDEVGELPLPVQVKLLRFLQSKEVMPVGHSKAEKVDVRIVSATHRDLSRLVAEGKLREDLYYRLNVITVDVPSLDERPEDIPVLANHFLVKYAAEYGSKAKAFTPAALEALVSRSWSGNVRELENVVQRALVACEGVLVDAGHLQLPMPLARPALASPSTRLPDDDSEDLGTFQESKKTAIDTFERAYLVRLLRRTRRMTEAAQLAGLDRKGLWRLMRKHGLRKGGVPDTDDDEAGGAADAA